jgi:hypothetical protein
MQHQNNAEELQNHKCTVTRVEATYYLFTKSNLMEGQNWCSHGGEDTKQ